LIILYLLSSTPEPCGNVVGERTRGLVRSHDIGVKKF
jgi:hypothetical protein